jgi:hypothetical protein
MERNNMLTSYKSLLLSMIFLVVVGCAPLKSSYSPTATEMPSYEAPVTKALKCPSIRCVVALGGESMGAKIDADGRKTTDVRLRVSESKVLIARYEEL